MLARVIGTIVIVLVLYAIISQPATAANTTRNAGGTLADAGSSVIVFFQSLVGGTSSNEQVRYQPVGGVATGDGTFR